MQWIANDPENKSEGNILSNMSGQAILMVLSLVSTRYVFKELGPNVLGIIYFSVMITSMLITLSDMGLSEVIAHEIAAHRYSDGRCCRWP